MPSLVSPLLRESAGPDLDLPHLHLIDGLEFRPLFIISDHRSGTTLLSELMARTQRFNGMTLHHVLCRNHLLHDHLNGLTQSEKDKIDQQFQKQGIVTRGIDKIAAGADTAVDYVLYLSMEMGCGMLKPSTVPTFLEFCRTIQYTGNPELPLILKSCPDYRNFLFIKRAIPNAKFLFLFREPIRILDSQLRIFQRSGGNDLAAIMPKRYAVVQSPFVAKLSRALFSNHLGVNPGLSGLIRRMKIAQRQLMADLPQLDSSDYTFIRYEDLMVDAQSHVERVLEFMGQTMPADVSLNSYIQPRNLPLLPELEKRQDELSRLFQPTRELVGYAGKA